MTLENCKTCIHMITKRNYCLIYSNSIFKIETCNKLKTYDETFKNDLILE